MAYELLENVLRIVDALLQAEEAEARIIQELFEDDNDLPALDVAADEENVPDALDDALQVILGEIFQMELLDEEEEEFVVELVYGRNEGHRDWRLELPRMQYLRHMEDPTFQQHFRMTRVVFERLIVRMGHHLTEKGRLIRLRTEIDKCLLMGLWPIFNLDTFRAIGVIFGVSKSIVHFHYLIVIEAMRELAPIFIQWPSLREKTRTKAVLQRKTGYDGICGMIDGTLIKVTAPDIQRERYFDRHHSYSFNVQAVCDENLLYRDIYVGEPGSVNDKRVFQRSPLHDLFLERDDVLSEEEHILGDGGYELTNKVLIPFRHGGNMTPRMRLFNYTHSSVRMCVERSFGLLRGRMRRLLKLYIKRHDYAIDHILSSFVLHNFILLEGLESEGMRCLIDADLVAGERDGNLSDEDDDEEDEDAIRDGGQNVDDNAGGQNVEDNAGGQPNNPRVRVRQVAHPLLAAAKAAGIRKRQTLADELFAIHGGPH